MIDYKSKERSIKLKRICCETREMLHTIRRYNNKDLYFKTNRWEEINRVELYI